MRVPLLTPERSSVVVPNLIYCVSRFARVGPIRPDGETSAIARWAPNRVWSDGCGGFSRRKQSPDGSHMPCTIARAVLRQFFGRAAPDRAHPYRIRLTARRTGSTEGGAANRKCSSGACVLLKFHLGSHLGDEPPPSHPYLLSPTENLFAILLLHQISEMQGASGESRLCTVGSSSARRAS